MEFSFPNCVFIYTQISQLFLSNRYHPDSPIRLFDCVQTIDQGEVAWNRVDRPVSGLLMIRNVLVMAKSGLVLFSREFANSVQQVCVCLERVVAKATTDQKSHGVVDGTCRFVFGHLVSREPLRLKELHRNPCCHNVSLAYFLRNSQLGKWSRFGPIHRALSP